VDHAVAGGRAAAQAVQILEVAALDAHADGGERLGAGVRASQAENPVAGPDEVLDHGGTNPPGRSGDEYTHLLLLALRPRRAAARRWIRNRCDTIYALESSLSSRSSRMPMDPLSDVLLLLKPRTYVAGGFELGGDWSIRFDAHTGIKCYALVSGGCWLAMDAVAEPVRLETGDCLLLPSGRPFRLAKDLDLEPVPFHALLSAERRGGIAVLDGGGDTMILGGHFAFTGAHADILLGAMPPVVHLRKDADKAALRWALERMRHELLEAQPGGVLVAQHLAHMMLVQALRLYLADGPERSVGWLFALADPQMAAAIGAVHADPGRGGPCRPWPSGRACRDRASPRSSRRPSGPRRWST